MKKDSRQILKFFIIAAVVIMSAVLIAGCINNDQKSAEPVLVIHADKESAHNVFPGEKIEIVLPSNPTTGYSWIVTEKTGLNVVQNYEQASGIENLVGAGGHDIFEITSDKAGTYQFTAEYKRPWENDTEPLYVYNFTAVFNEPKDNNTGIESKTVLKLTFDGVVNPKAGEIVSILIDGNPTTGYKWSSVSDGLKVISSKYTPNDSHNQLGVGGVYDFRVTAEKAGTYIFKAEYKRPWDNSVGHAGAEPAAVIYFDLTFI